MTFRSVLAVPAVALVLGGAGSAVAAPTALHAMTVDVKAKDYSFALSPKVGKPGRVTFAIKNVGHTEHDFTIAGHTSKMVQPGQTVRLTVTLRKRGRYPYRCSVDSHAELGMKGVFRVMS